MEKSPLSKSDRRQIYRQSPEGKAAVRRWNSGPGYKAAHQKWRQGNGREVVKAWLRTDRFREIRKKYLDSEPGQISTRLYRQRPYVALNQRLDSQRRRGEQG